MSLPVYLPLVIHPVRWQKLCVGIHFFTVFVQPDMEIPVPFGVHLRLQTLKLISLKSIQLPQRFSLNLVDFPPNRDPFLVQPHSWIPINAIEASQNPALFHKRRLPQSEVIGRPLPQGAIDKHQSFLIF